jgi:uncharacterized membrane protein
MSLYDPSDAAAAEPGERTTLIVAYALDLIAPFTGFLVAIVSVIISHIKAGETQNQFIRSHHRWLIRTFWWNLAWAIVFGLLTLVLIGYLGLIGLVIWWYYRMIRGLIDYSNGKPMPG